MKNIAQEAFLSLRIIVPPLPEQRKIADILGTWDQAIGAQERLIAALQERKRGLMQRVLTGQVRFSEFVRSDDMRVTKYGAIPIDWAYEVSPQKHGGRYTGTNESARGGVKQGCWTT